MRATAEERVIVIILVSASPSADNDNVGQPEFSQQIHTTYKLVCNLFIFYSTRIVYILLLMTPFLYNSETPNIPGRLISNEGVTG